VSKITGQVSSRRPRLADRDDGATERELDASHHPVRNDHATSCQHSRHCLDDHDRFRVPDSRAWPGDARRVPDCWCSADRTRPTGGFDALERARVVLVQAWRNDLTPDEITITPQGGVTIAWRRAGWALELIVDPFALSAFRLDSPSKMVEWTRAGSEATIADAKAALAAMAGDSAKARAPQAAAS